jgi:hypothetical protein
MVMWQALISGKCFYRIVFLPDQKIRNKEKEKGKKYEAKFDHSLESLV